MAVATLPLALAWSASGLREANVDDQAAADAAVAVFNERLSDAGWVSLGPPPELESADIRDDRPFGDCFGGLDVVVFANTELRLDGETARAFTDDFRIGDLEPDSTDPVPDYGYIAAGVFTVTDSSVEALDDVVTMVGAAETAACLTAPGTAQGETATFDDHVGVGDASARLDVSYSIEGFGQVTETVLAARIDRSLVTMVVYTGGDFQLDLNPVAELAAIIDAVGERLPAPGLGSVPTLPPSESETWETITIETVPPDESDDLVIADTAVVTETTLAETSTFEEALLTAEDLGGDWETDGAEVLEFGPAAEPFPYCPGGDELIPPLAGVGIYFMAPSAGDVNSLLDDDVYEALFVFAGPDELTTWFDGIDSCVGQAWEESSDPVEHVTVERFEAPDLGDESRGFRTIYAHSQGVPEHDSHAVLVRLDDVLVIVQYGNHGLDEPVDQPFFDVLVETAVARAEATPW